LYPSEVTVKRASDSLPPTEVGGTEEPTADEETLTHPRAPGPTLPPGVRIGPYVVERELGADHAETAEALVLLGRLLVDGRRFSEAEAPLVRAVSVMDTQKGLEARRREARDAIVRLYEKWGRPEEAARFRPT